MHTPAILILLVWAVLLPFLVPRARVGFRLARARAALRAGNPRRFRAILRSFRRVSPSTLRSSRILYEAVGLFWEGAFDGAIAETDRLIAPVSAAAPAALALKIESLIFEGRSREARALFAIHAESLRSYPAHRYAGTSGEALDAMLRFHEGDVEQSRLILERLLRENGDEGVPFSLVARYYLAAIAHKEGRESAARTHLVAVVVRGADLFIARWARDTHNELFPTQPIAARAIPRKREPPPVDGLRGLLRNLRVGVRLLAFRRAAVGNAPYSYEQTILLLLANLLVVALLGGVDYSRDAIFLEFSAAEAAAPVLFFVVASYLATRTLGVRGAALQLCARFYCALPALLYLEWVAGRLRRHGDAMSSDALRGVVAVWSLALLVYLVRRLAPRAHFLRVLGSGAILAAMWSAPTYYWLERTPMWVEPPTRSYAGADERAELVDFIYSQADSLHAASSGLLRGRQGVDDLYFVGVAGWDQQDVFFKETKFARHLFDERFDTSGRSLILANDPSARDVPAASGSNLSRVLKLVGSRMDREEDVLFLFMTSHGSERELGLRSAAFPLLLDEEGLEPADLRTFLDDAGIKWRVLVVSACRSGAFVSALRNEFTLIATAAASDRASFGCANGNDFTEFGRAVFAEQLVHEHSFVAAFTNADKVIKERELKRGLEPSEPQLFVGSAIAPKLDALEARLGALSDAGVDGAVERGD